MKDFSGFLKVVNNSDIKQRLQDEINNNQIPITVPMPGGEDMADSIACHAWNTSFLLSVRLLEYYHKWLELEKQS